MSLPVALIAAAFLVLLGAAECIGRKGVPPEWTRRTVHVLGGVIVAGFPSYLSLREVGFLATLFTLLLLVTFGFRQQQSLHGIGRPSVGVLVFPIGLFLGCVIAWHSRAAVAYATLVLALADPAAAMAGQASRGFSWSVPGGRKSAAGALAFFTVTLLLGLAISLAAGHISPAGVVVGAVILSLLENVSFYGLDNLFLPPVAAVIGLACLGL